MKAWVLLLFLPLLVPAQNTPSEEEQLFVALYTVGTAWVTEKSPNEQPYFKEHSAFLSQLRKEGTIVMGARYSDTGMIVLKAIDIGSATELLQSDIAVQQNLFNVEVHAFSPFYKGCLD